MTRHGKTVLVVTGGQMGMGYNPETGSVQPIVTPEEMLSWLPRIWPSGFPPWSGATSQASHYTMRMTFDLMQVFEKAVVDGASGVVVSCGTDTLEEMAYLTDLYWSYPQPVIFTGTSIPSSDLGGDAPANLYQAVLASVAEETWGMGVLGR